MDYDSISSARRMSPSPSAGFEIFVPGRQDFSQDELLIPHAGAPYLIGTSPRTFFLPMRRTSLVVVLASLIFAFCRVGIAQSGAELVKKNDVTWNSLGTNENDSMPLGNG